METILYNNLPTKYSDQPNELNQTTCSLYVTQALLVFSSIYSRQPNIQERETLLYYAIQALNAFFPFHSNLGSVNSNTATVMIHALLNAFRDCLVTNLTPSVPPTSRVVQPSFFAESSHTDIHPPRTDRSGRQPSMKKLYNQNCK